MDMFELDSRVEDVEDTLSGVEKEVGELRKDMDHIYTHLGDDVSDISEIIGNCVKSGEYYREGYEELEERVKVLELLLLDVLSKESNQDWRNLGE